MRIRRPARPGRPGANRRAGRRCCNRRAATRPPCPAGPAADPARKSWPASAAPARSRRGSAAESTVSMRSVAVRRRASTSTPKWPSSSASVSTSARSGTPARRTGPVGQDRGGHDRQGGVLRAADRDRAVQRHAAGDAQTIHASHPLSRASGTELAERSCTLIASLPSRLRDHAAGRPDP